MDNISSFSTDVLVVGSGGAGMRAAISASDLGVNVAIISKGKFGVSGATVTASADVSVDSRSIKEFLGLEGDAGDSKEHFFEDTIIGGKFLNNQKLVEILVDEAPQRAKELIEWGATVKHVYKTPGHRYPRGLWIDGREFALTLVKEVKKRPIKIIENCLALEIAQGEHGATGVFCLDLNSGSYLTIKAKAIVVATGGAMNVFPLTTAPNDLIGDGMVMAYKAGVELVDMEFPMFLLGCCYPPAVRGLNFPFALLCRAGAHLYNREGERYMEKWDPVRKEHSTRDHLTIGSTIEILEGRGGVNGGVWVSMKHLPDDLIEYFFEWYGKWHGKGKYRYECFDIKELFPRIASDGIEAKPAAHFWDGGIRISENAETSIPGLFAAGEVTGGNHGANRLSGNAMTETLVWGARSGKSAAGYAKKIHKTAASLKKEKEVYGRTGRFIDPGEKGKDYGIIEIKNKLQELAWECIGPVRSEKELEKLLEFISQVKESIPKHRCSNKSRLFNREWVDAISLGKIIDILKTTALSAITRKESRGSHFRKEYPLPDKEWIKNIVIKEGTYEEPILFDVPIVITTLKPEVPDLEKK